MRRPIALCWLLAACHSAGGVRPQASQLETWEVVNGSPCVAHVRIATSGSDLVQRVGTVPAWTTQSFDLMSTLTHGNSVQAVPVEPDGKSACRNDLSLLKKVVVRKVASG